MDDLTIIMLTANRVPEKWAEFHKQVLLEAANNRPIITISAKPMDWGLNLIQDEYGIGNLYYQVLRGAKAAKTKYIAIAEDDCLYHGEHFNNRPKEHTFLYNFSIWGLITWDRRPFYNHRRRAVNSTLIAPRELVINALEERYSQYPDGIIPGRIGYELGTSLAKNKYDKRGFEVVYTNNPVVIFRHPYGMDDYDRRQIKKPWPLWAYDIPHWGRADDLVKRFC